MLLIKVLLIKEKACNITLAHKPVLVYELIMHSVTRLFVKIQFSPKLKYLLILDVYIIKSGIIVDKGISGELISEMLRQQSEGGQINNIVLEFTTLTREYEDEVVYDKKRIPELKIKFLVQSRRQKGQL